MYLENLFASLDVGGGYHDAAVEAPRPQQGRVENIGAVGGGDDNDPFVGVEAVHFHQQLVQGLFALVVTAAQSRAALAAHGVDLVDEDQAGSVLLAFVKEIAHP